MLNKKIDIFEARRQAFHIFLGIFIVMLLKYDIIGKWSILPCIAIGLLLSYLSRETKLPVIYWLIKIFERRDYVKKFPGRGMIFYLMGSFIVVAFFPKDIAMSSIMILALGDSSAHFFGLNFGRTKHPLSKTKLLEGTVAGLIAGFLGAVFFIKWHEALFSSLAAIIAEAIEVKIGNEHVDDNLIVPFVAGSVVWIMRNVLK